MGNDSITIFKTYMKQVYKQTMKIEKQIYKKSSDKFIEDLKLFDLKAQHSLYMKAWRKKDTKEMAKYKAGNSAYCNYLYHNNPNIRTYLKAKSKEAYSKIKAKKMV